ncbi:MAG: LLM class F420-dependent oxidoreductase, partial [Acidimicrobiales bacterium]
YEGSHYRFGGVVVEPAGLDRRVEIWVGGRTRRSLRRAAELGDGWIPFGLGRSDVAGMLGAAERRPAEIVLAPDKPLDPAGDRDGATEVVRSYGALGATGLSLRFRHRSREHYVEQLAAMAAVMADAES